MKLARFFVLTFAILGVPATSQAGIVVYSAPGFVQPDENLMFNASGLISGPANPVTGATNATGFVINLSSNENLVTPSGGQARVEAADGASSTLTLTPNAANPNFAFTEAEFNVNTLNQTSAFLKIEIQGKNGATPFNFTTQVDKDGNPLVINQGSNWFGIDTTAGDVITSLKITAIDGSGNAVQIIQDVRQIRVSGLDNPGSPGGGGGGTVFTPVPEPTSALAFGLLIAGVGGYAWRRSRKAPAPAA
jgi:hypothetical protein